MANDQADRPESGEGPNARALEESLTALRQAGRLEPVDAVKVQALRSIAAALDVKPWNSQMWREYREAFEGLVADDGNDGTVDALLERLSSSVRDTSAS